MHLRGRKAWRANENRNCKNCKERKGARGGTTGLLWHGLTGGQSCQGGRRVRCEPALGLLLKNWRC
jgi:hypothetical protein